MAFAKKATEVVTKRTVDDFFKAVKHQKVALKIALYGRAKKGKTHFCISAAEYVLKHHPTGFVYIIDTEGDAHLNASTWPQEIQDRLRIFNAVSWVDKENGKVDLVESLKLLQESIDVLTDMIIENEELPEAERKYGFIVIDSGSDVWEWLSMWLETIETKKNSKDGSMMQTEWGKANKRYMDMIRMLLRTNWHMICTFRAFQAFSDAKPLDYDLPKWQKNTDFWFNCIMESKKVQNDFWFYFRGGRFGNLPENDPLINPTWESLKDKVSTYSSLEFV